eukprot:TRINITY_DN63862_c0_g1_i1.p1 TRINITY_DN63862_c0_g1~~TRINITY_DN63862_c0_g1_i1.p1  ORF type:complete len:484 (+),score=58.94 TRINITY_DN63862_c0_g1_i1:22-1473(+)
MLSVLVACLLIFGVAVSASCNVESNVEYEGFDITPACGLEAEDAGECCDKCSAEPLCKFFTWIPSSKSCCLKTLDSGRRSNATTVSGLAVVRQGGGRCTNDYDCSLGGICSSGACICDDWFTGATCSDLNLAPVKDVRNALQVPGYHTWGGRCGRDEKSGKYVGIFSFMTGGCSLAKWTSASAIVAADADRPEGPYTLLNGTSPDNLHENSPALVNRPWAHNAFVIHDKASNLHLIFRIGDARLPEAKWCRNDSSSESQVGGSEYSSDPIFVSSSASLYGPWDSPGLRLNLSGPKDSWVKSVSNPSPFIFPNGTVLLFTSAQNCPKDWGARAPKCIAVFRASTWRGPYELLSVKAPLVHPESEDPFVFQDPRGNFHLLTNVNTYHRRCNEGAACGGHAWSRDALSWSPQVIGAFGPAVAKVDGSIVRNSYRERPLVYQDENGIPVTFFSGLGTTSYFNAISWAQPFVKGRTAEEKLQDVALVV